MEQIVACNAAYGQAIGAVLPETAKIYGPILAKNKEAILAIPRYEHSYGPHPRQTLDVYEPKDGSKDAPVLIFFHGGGLIRGDKIVPMVPGDLVYHNVGTFFALRGLKTLIPNYRRVNTPNSGEDAVFPSGAEDVSLVLKWLEGQDPPTQRRRDVYLLGNSAGGVHVSSFVLDSRFLAQRRAYSPSSPPLPQGLNLKGLLNLAVPFHFRSADASRSPVTNTYYGSAEGTVSNCGYGLLASIAASGKTREELAVPKCLAMLGEFDPEDEIGSCVKDFVSLWREWDADSITFEMLPGQNHISPPLALMSGEAAGEKWAEDVVAWIKKQS